MSRQVAGLARVACGFGLRRGARSLSTQLAPLDARPYTSCCTAAQLPASLSALRAPTQLTLCRSFAKGMGSKNDKKDMKKKKGAKKSKSKPSAGAVGEGEEMPVDMMLLEEKMEKSIDYLTAQLANIRIGRASPELLEDFQIDAYGDKTPLKNVAQVSVRGAQLLVVSVMDPKLVPKVEEAIRAASSLGLNPFQQGDALHVPLPKPTQEVRDSFLKASKTKGEEVKTTLKRVRQDGLQQLKKKSKGISEDLVHNCQEAIQELFDDYNERVVNMVKTKEAELKES